MPSNPYQKYQQQSVMTMTKGEMLIRLYDEVIKQLSLAVVRMQEKNLADVNQALQKSQRILAYLKATLDFQYKISHDLSDLYDYFTHQIVQANLKKDPRPLEEIIPMINDLRESFQQADRNARTQ